MRLSNSAPGKPLPGEPPKKKPFLTVAEAAELLKLSPQEVQQLAARGGLPGTRTTGDWLFPVQMLEKWQRDQALRAQQTAIQRSASQKLGGLAQVKPLTSSTESYDLSIIDELDLPDL